MKLKLMALSVICLFAIINTAPAAVENIKVSGNIATYAVDRSDFDLGAAGGQDDAISLLASYSLLKFNADLTEDVEGIITVRDRRIWGGNSTLDLHQAYVTLKDVLESPITFQIGLQGWNLGSGLILGDLDTNRTSTDDFGTALIGDLSPAKGMTGIKAIVDLEPATLTAGYVKRTESTTSVDNDTNIYFGNLNYKLTDTALAELYYIYKDTQGKSTASRVAQDNVQNIGARMVYTAIDNLTLSTEGAYQSGKEDTTQGGRMDGQHRSDFAAMVAGKYVFPDLSWKPAIGLDYTYLSQNWDPMYENLTPARIANALFFNSNTMYIGTDLGVKPREDLSLTLRFANVRLVEDNITGLSYTNGYATYALDTDDKDLGQELDFTVGYDYTEDVKMSLFLDYFHPGDAFAEANDQSAFQAVGSMMVSF